MSESNIDRDLVDLSPEQQKIFERLIDALTKRHGRMQDALTGTINGVKVLFDLAEDSGDPTAEVLNQLLMKLVQVAAEGACLQMDTVDILYSQLIRMVSAKRAYDQGWQDRLLDLLASATPEQIAILHNLLIDSPEDLGAA